MSFSCTHKKRTKRNRERSVRPFVQTESASRRLPTRVCTRKLVQATAEHAERAASAIGNFAPAGADFPVAVASRTVRLPCNAEHCIAP